MKRKTFKKIFIFILSLALILSITLSYLNKFVLPVKLKSLIIQALSSQTRKKVTLESVRFNLFKGIVLRNLNIYDGQKALVGLKEASCTFLILPIFKEKKIIIPSIRIIEPAIFLERKPDNTLNLLELTPGKAPEEKKPRFAIVVSGISITAGHIDFQDDTLSPSFTKRITGLDLDASFSLPASIRFEVKGRIEASPEITVNAQGQFLIPHKELKAKISIQNLPPKDFSPYYSNFGLAVKDGRVDASLDLHQKGNLLMLEVTAQNKNISLSRDKISLSLNTGISAKLRYDFEDKRLAYSGRADIFKTGISGIETIDEIKDINGRLNFSDAGIASDKILATVFGMPIEAKINLADFKSPAITLEAASELNLLNLQKICLEKFKIQLPAEITGQGKLLLNVTAKLPIQEAPKIKGSLNISSAAIKIDKIASPLKDIQGLITFDMDKLNWANLSFKYQESAYQTKGELTDYLPAGQAGKNPAVNLSLSSPELSLSSRFSLTKDKLLKIAELKGRYLNSGFLLKGDLDISDTQSIPARLNIDADINLEDLDKPLREFKGRLEQIRPSGLVKTRINLQGSLNHPKLLRIEAEASSSSLSAYGLKSDEFTLQYKQSQGIADAPLIRLAMYDGTIEVSAKVNLDTESMPFWIEAKINDINIGKLKADTPVKKQDISGTLQAISRLNGFIADFSKLSGSGQILVKDGKLWELNLFKGLGKLIFSRNFSDITFSKGYCDFFIKDQSVFTENLTMISPLVSLEGKGRIGFDGSLSAAMNVQLSEEMIPETGTFKDFTTALMGVPGRFAVIDISGTLQKPEFKFKATMLEVIKGITGSVIENIFGQ